MSRAEQFTFKLPELINGSTDVFVLSHDVVSIRFSCFMVNCW
jgi:hypothetical protein